MAESTRQREAFDSYWQLGAERSIRDAGDRTGHIRRESNRRRDRPRSHRIASGRRRERPLVQPARGYRGRVAARNAHRVQIEGP